MKSHKREAKATTLINTITTRIKPNVWTRENKETNTETKQKETNKKTLDCRKYRSALKYDIYNINSIKSETKT